MIKWLTWLIGPLENPDVTVNSIRVKISETGVEADLGSMIGNPIINEHMKHFNVRDSK